MHCHAERGGNTFGGLTALGKKAGGGGPDPGPLPRYGELGGIRWALRRISAAQVLFCCLSVTSHWTKELIIVPWANRDPLYSSAVVEVHSVHYTHNPHPDQ